MLGNKRIKNIIMYRLAVSHYCVTLSEHMQDVCIQINSAAYKYIIPISHCTQEPYIFSIREAKLFLFITLSLCASWSPSWLTLEGEINQSFYDFYPRMHLAIANKHTIPITLELPNYSYICSCETLERK